MPQSVVLICVVCLFLKRRTRCDFYILHSRLGLKNWKKENLKFWRKKKLFFRCCWAKKIRQQVSTEFYLPLLGFLIVVNCIDRSTKVPKYHFDINPLVPRVPKIKIRSLASKGLLIADFVNVLYWRSLY